MATAGHLAVARPREPRVVSPPPLALGDLHNDAATLVRLLVEQASHGTELNVFLLAAGLRQIAEDRLEADALHLADAGRLLAARGSRRAVAGVGAAAGLLATGRSVRRAADLRAVRRWDAAAGRLLAELAGVVASGEALSRERREALAAGARVLAETLPSAPGFRSAVLRLPSCFRSSRPASRRLRAARRPLRRRIARPRYALARRRRAPRRAATSRR